MDKLVLKKGGKLIKTAWDKDKEEWGDEDISQAMFISPRWLYEVNFYLDTDVTLRDVFLYMNNNPTYWEVLLGNWAEEYIAEGLKAPSEPKDPNIHCVEMYWMCETSHEDEGVYVICPKFMDMHMPGVWGKDEPEIGAKKEDETNYSVMFTPANNLAPYPLKINPEFKIYKDICECKNLKKGQEVLFEADIRQPSLFEVLYGIVWELSFCGSPTDRDKEDEKIHQAMQDYKDGKLELIPAEEVFNEAQKSDETK